MIFPLAVDAEKGWFGFAVRCEHPFLRNIYSYEDLKKINIESEANYRNIIEYYPLFESYLQEAEMCDEVLNFLTEDLNRCERTILEDLREEIDHISIPNKRFSSKKTFFSKKLIAFLCSNMVKFCETSKVKEIPLS